MGNNALKKGNAKLIISAIVFVIILIAVALVFTAGKRGSENTTSVVASTNTIPTTTQQYPKFLSFQSWQGQNISLAQFNSQLDGFTLAKASRLNVTYNYSSALAFKGAYNFSENITGTINILKYYDNSTVNTTSNTSEGVFSNIVIYNATTNKQYACSDASGSEICATSNFNGSIFNNSGGLSLVGGTEGSNSLKGYYRDIVVSNTTYKGQPCTLITGNLYANTETAANPSGVVLNGVLGSCISTQYGVWLNQSLKGTVVVSIKGNVTTATINYTQNEQSISTNTTAAITRLPGPLSN